MCRHPRVVACLDLIEVDNNTFASILELCPGGDLDGHLQEHQVGQQSWWLHSTQFAYELSPDRQVQNWSPNRH